MTLSAVMTPQEWREVLDYLHVASGELRHLAQTAQSDSVKPRMQAHAQRCDELRDRIAWCMSAPKES